MSGVARASDEVERNQSRATHRGYQDILTGLSQTGWEAEVTQAEEQIRRKTLSLLRNMTGEEIWK